MSLPPRPYAVRHQRSLTTRPGRWPRRRTGATSAWLAAFICLGAAACAEAGTRPEARTNHPQATLAPSVRASAAVVPGAPPPAPTVEPARLRLERELIRELPCSAQVFQVGTEVLVPCGEDVWVPDDTRGLRPEPRFARGLGLRDSPLDARGVFALAGEWPSSAWAATGEVSGNGNAITLRFFRWRTDRWVSTGKNAEQGGAEARVAFVWTADGLGALVANAYAATRFFAFSGKPVTVPALTLATQTAAEREQYPCRHVMVAPEAAVQLTAGDVMVFSGALCGVGGSGDPQGLGVERLRAGRKQGDVALLPLPSELPAGVTWTVDAAAAASPIDVMVVAHGFDNPVGDQKPQRFSYAARWDGQTWRLDDAAPQQLRRLWAIGGRFAALDEQGRLWLQRAGAWLEVEWQGDSASAEKPGELTQLSRVGQETWLVQENELPEGAFSSRVYRVKVE